MIVCICRRITDREIAQRARQGMGFDEIQMQLGAASQCGQCADCVKDVIEACQMAPADTLRCYPMQLAQRITESPAWPSFSPLSAA